MTRQAIAVRAHGFTASLNDFSALVERLDVDEGMVYGCEYAGGPPFVNSSIALLRPALVLSFDDGALELRARDTLGEWLGDRWPDAAEAPWVDGCRRITYGSPTAPDGTHPVVHALRGFMRAFAPVPASSHDAGVSHAGLFGAWNFDYHALAGPLAGTSGAALRPRFVLYLPDRLLLREGSQVRGIELAFEGAPAPGESRPSMGEHGLPRTDAREASDDFDSGAYAAAVARAVERITAGDVISLTLSQAFRRPMRGTPARAFQKLRSAYAMPEMFLLHMPGNEYLLGASPDMQLRLRDGRVETAPVCGTLPRGGDPIEDADLAFELLASEKEASAIALCSDHYRDRLAAICDPGSVELVSRRRLHHFASVIHMVDHLRGRPRAELDAWDMLLQFAAPGVVSGIPTSEALRVIRKIEASPRQWFGGAVGQFGFDGSMQVGTILRSAWIRDGIAEIRAGGVLVSDSKPAAEEDESRLKAQTLLRLIASEGSAAGDPTSAASPPRAADTRDRVHVVGKAAFNDSLMDFIARVGLPVTSTPADADVLVVTESAAMDVLRTLSRQLVEEDGRPCLWIGSAAIDHLQATGARCTPLGKPRYGVPTKALPESTRELDAEHPLTLGLYARAVVRAGDLPADWQAWLVSTDGDVLVAGHLRLPHVALACRPDSNIAIKHRSGERLFLAVLRAVQQRR